MDCIISLTSWSGRINSIGERLDNIRTMCPGWRVVLVLSVDEFPDRDVSVPDYVEIIWVYGNPKAFKKVLYTMRKYPDAVIVSADDDMVYKCNFADLLFKKWLKFPSCVITNVSNVKTGGIRLPNGYCTLYPPHCMDDALQMLTPAIIATNNDDGFYGVILTAAGVPMQYLGLGSAISDQINDGKGMSDNGDYISDGNADIKLIINELRKNPRFISEDPTFTRKWLS